MNMWCYNDIKIISNKYYLISQYDDETSNMRKITERDTLAGSILVGII